MTTIPAATLVAGPLPPLAVRWWPLAGVAGLVILLWCAVVLALAESSDSATHRAEQALRSNEPIMDDPLTTPPDHNDQPPSKVEQDSA